MWRARPGRVANDGTAVFTADRRGIYVLQDNQVAVIATLGIPSNPVIDAAARTIVFASGPPCGDLYCGPQPSELRITSPGASGTDLLVSGGYSPSLTDDGRQVLYLSDRSGAPQAHLINADGSGDRCLTNDPDGIARASSVSLKHVCLGRLCTQASQRYRPPSGFTRASEAHISHVKFIGAGGYGEVHQVINHSLFLY